MRALNILIIFFYLLSFVGCSNEVEVIGIWKDIPVVYGVVDSKDSVNYIRIERAYLPPNQSALEVAKIPDSIYFDTAQLRVTMYYLMNGDTIPTQALEYVNLMDENIDRESGIFVDDPAYAFKLKGFYSRPLYLKIEHFKTGNVFTAFTETVNPNVTLLFTTPSYSYIPYKPVQWAEINNTADTVFSTLLVEMTSTGFASIYDFKFRFHYDEFEVDNNNNPVPSTLIDTFIEWKAASDFIPQNASQTKKSFSGENFFRFLASNLSDLSGTNKRRCASFLEVFVDGGSSSLKEYILSRQSNEGFVGGLYPSEPYTNIEGGFGILATKGRLERKDRANDPRLMRMSNLTVLYLSNSAITSDLGFFPDACY